MEEHLDTEDLARREDVAARTVIRWRATGEGPPFIRVGPRRVLYRLADVEAWERERTFKDRAAELARGEARHG